MSARPFALNEPRCPCYCGGEGFIGLVRCVGCSRLLGLCDEVDSLIDLDPIAAIEPPACPGCARPFRFDFPLATEDDIRAAGLAMSEVTRWGMPGESP